MFGTKVQAFFNKNKIAFSRREKNKLVYLFHKIKYNYFRND